jgi:hypothetical protein
MTSTKATLRMRLALGLLSLLTLCSVASVLELQSAANDLASTAGQMAAQARAFKRFAVPQTTAKAHPRAEPPTRTPR